MRRRVHSALVRTQVAQGHRQEEAPLEMRHLACLQVAVHHPLNLHCSDNTATDVQAVDAFKVDSPVSVNWEVRQVKYYSFPPFGAHRDNGLAPVRQSKSHLPIRWAAAQFQRTVFLFYFHHMLT